MLLTRLLGLRAPLRLRCAKSKRKTAAARTPRQIADGSMRHAQQLARRAALVRHNHDARSKRGVVANKSNLGSVGAPTRKRVLGSLGHSARRAFAIGVSHPHGSFVRIARANNLALKQNLAAVGRHARVANTNKL